MESALREVRAVLADQPFRAETWEMLGAALAKIGQPERAQAAQIIAAPTLVKELPPPLRRLIGDLTDPDRVLVALNLKPRKT